MRGLRTGSIALLAAALAVAAGLPAAAAPGDPDGGFGTAGLVTDIPGVVEAVYEAPDGRILVGSVVGSESSSTVHLQRYTAGGQLDPSFSGDGSLSFATGSGAQTAIHVDGAGRTILVTTTVGPTPRFRVARFEPDGDADPTFSGDGVVTFDGEAAGFSLVAGIGVQPDGDLIVGTTDSFPSGGIGQLPQLVRITNGGVVGQTIDVLADYTESRRGSLAVVDLDAAGRPYVLVPDDGRLIVRRYTEALALDTSYSGDGLVAVGRPGGGADNENWGPSLLEVSPAGVALVSGVVGTFSQVGPVAPTEVRRPPIVARLTAGGVLDTTFSADGVASLVQANDEAQVDDLHVSAAGAITVAGLDYDLDYGEGDEHSMVVWALTTTGGADASFSGDGRVETPLGLGTFIQTVVADGTRLLSAQPFSSTSVLAARQLRTPVQPAAGSVYVPVTPCRVVDTRAGGGALAAGSSRSVQVGGGGGGFAAQGGRAGGCGVPDGAAAVEASVTAVGPSANGFLRAWPAGLAEPSATFLNFVQGQSITNTGALTLAASGVQDLTLRGSGGAAQYVIDVQGYYVEPADLPVGAVGSVYVPVTPCRVVDTRSGGGVLAAGSSRSVQVGGGGGGFAAQGGRAGGCGVPDGAAAVEASVTAVGPSANGYLRAWPNGVAEPNATFLNFVRGQSITNTGAITLAPNGVQDLTLRASGGATNAVIDVQGYFVAPDDVPVGAVGSVFTPITPCRVVDTRSGGGTLAAGSSRSVQVGGGGGGFAAQGGRAGGCGVPDGAAAVEASVTAVGPSANGYLRAWPNGVAEPNATFLNFVGGQNITNTGAITLAPNGVQDLTWRASGGATNAVIDVQGYFTPTG